MNDIDYSLYLVTGRELLPPGKDYFESLEESLQGGVTVVQIREKNTDTGEFIKIARASKVICDIYNVPLLINDRVDVALAINAHGVHLGQDDMPIALARKMLPKDAVIGVSCNNVDHVKAAVKDGADYVGIGAVWGTKSKSLTSPIIGVRGVGVILEVLDGTNVKALAIGGIKSTNLLRTLHGTVSSTGHALDGIAVISEIVSSTEPRRATETLANILSAFRADFPHPPGLDTRLTSDLYVTGDLSPEAVLEGVVQLLETIRGLNPLVHQITNTVVATQSANITLALGASPIMATEPREMEDLAKISGALLVNIGTLRGESFDGMKKGGFFANQSRKPIVFDPVGVGASAFRQETVNELLNTWQASVIKGNAGELAALAGTKEVDSKGVDSVGSGFKDPVSFVKALAKRERCVVVLTGATDYISDGLSVVSLKNGDAMLGKITGSGCVLGSCIAAFCATAAHLASDEEKKGDGKLAKGDMFLGAIAGVLVLTVAAELAVQREDVKGPGSFLSGLIDTLWALHSDDVQNLAKVSIE